VRALAHARKLSPRFSDPTAYALLPESTQQQVDEWLAAPPPTTPRDRIRHSVRDTRAYMMVERSIEIDDGIRGSGAKQLVILGAGLDGRAWRMPELADTVVFEVDHPDTQKLKRSAVDQLSQTAKEVRFVPVDFTKDRLEDALAGAGHDPSEPTIWVWEGVVMYLRPDDVEATLSVISSRSAPGSRLLVMYTRRSVHLLVVGAWLRRMGEPIRSSYSREKMARLLAQHGFRVVRDRSLPEMGADISADAARLTRRLRFHRIATADRT
jgi:methyltransferase (TIGR00027 family)